MAYSCLTRNQEETQALAQEILPFLTPGAVFLLEGPLGAGKTTFVRGVLRALGYDGPVKSPTFNLVQEYATNPPLIHADLYRLTGCEGLGLEDFLDTHAFFIEWPHVGTALFHPQDCWRIQIDVAENDRIVTILSPQDQGHHSP
jgi:tRNA threonylcarbamoyladenosine biosynthesis protein TsaE